MSDRWPARRSAGGDAALWVAAVLLFLAVAALVLGGSREPGLGMLLMCALAAALALAGTVLLILAIGYQRLNAWQPNAGATYAWVGRTLNPYAGFFAGWYDERRIARDHGEARRILFEVASGLIQQPGVLDLRHVGIFEQLGAGIGKSIARRRTGGQRGDGILLQLRAILVASLAEESAGRESTFSLDSGDLGLFRT